jgi:DNA mismatch repair ATPase MutS
MKAFLMYRDRDFDMQSELPQNEPALTQDLELNTLFNAMAGDDKFLFEVARWALLSGLDNDPETILHRQNVLRDCLKNAIIVREIHRLAVEAIENEKKNYWSFLSRHPNVVLHRSVEVLQMFVTQLKKLKRIADDHASQFQSEGFTAFFAMLEKELDDEYFATIEHHLAELKFRGGVLISADLEKGNKGGHYLLRKNPDEKHHWVRRLFAQKTPACTFRLHPRDEAGAQALSELTNRGINRVANALAQSTDHVLSFFNLLRIESGFYVSCLNLHERLEDKQAPLCFPLPAATDNLRHSFTGLYDICLALTLEQRVVGNDVNADGINLVLITGANRGGKSTFLRSIGLSQLMMQAGMFVPAEAFSANVCDRLFTHYKREEDVTMKSGKFDEELSRMNDIADHVTSHSMLLFNESFAATNEREGSEISRQITRALLEKHVKIFFVTHSYEFAHGFVGSPTGNVIFLRAERQPDGRRTFKLIEAEPLQTSYGEDLYRAIFADGRETDARAAPAKVALTME